jgi:iron uptake system EfeUOB component EfeO/EfeM
VLRQETEEQINSSQLQNTERKSLHIHPAKFTAKAEGLIKDNATSKVSNEAQGNANESDEDLIANEHIAERISPMTKLGRYQRKQITQGNAYKRKLVDNGTNSVVEITLK